MSLQIRRIMKVFLAYGTRLLPYIVDFIFPPPERLGFLENISQEELGLYRCNEDTEHILHASKILIISLLLYRTPVIKEMIWQLKYKGNIKIATVFAQLIYNELSKVTTRARVTTGEIIILPMPNSVQRRKERGFNQCELITDEIEKIVEREKNTLHPYNGMGIRVHKNILIKCKETPRQTMNNRAERLKNIKDCFEVREGCTDLVRDHIIIIIDDVTTTGSTMTEAIRTLEAGGALLVKGLTIAR